MGCVVGITCTCDIEDCDSVELVQGPGIIQSGNPNYHCLRVSYGWVLISHNNETKLLCPECHKEWLRITESYNEAIGEFFNPKG